MNDIIEDMYENNQRTKDVMQVDMQMQLRAAEPWEIQFQKNQIIMTWRTKDGKFQGKITREELLAVVKDPGQQLVIQIEDDSMLKMFLFVCMKGLVS